MQQRMTLAAFKKQRAATFADRLDAAVAEAFPTAECKTEFSIFSMAYQSHWFVKGSVTEDAPRGKPLARPLAAQVLAFVKGFSEAESFGA